MAKLHLGLIILAGGLFAWSCSSTKETNYSLTGTDTGTGTNTNTGTDPGGGINTDPGGGINTDPGTSTDPDAGYRRRKVCDANGENCKCMNLASIGASASKSYGSGSDSTTEFETWLTTKSNASVTFFTDKPGTIDMAWLNNYDVILLQDLRAWVFSTAEQAAFQQWVTEGGGVMALSGYYSDNALEIDNTNMLLSNTGMSLLPTEVPGQSCGATDVAAVAGSTLVCPNSKASASGKCYCWGNSLPLTEWNADHPTIKDSVTAIGSFRGRAVNPGTTGATVVSYGGTPVGATTTVGNGKVFIFGDEWVTYTSQWLDGGKDNVTTDPYNPCWNETKTASCQAGLVFQTKQFWYNSLLYVSPPTECDFVIKEPEVIIQ